MMSDSFYEKEKVKLYPGTLNVKLDKLYNLTPDFIINKEEYGGNFNVQIQKCKILNNDAYIVRSEKNISDKGDYRQDIIEVVANINFRQKYNLNDYDLIEIEI